MEKIIYDRWVDDGEAQVILENLLDNICSVLELNPEKARRRLHGKKGEKQLYVDARCIYCYLAKKILPQCSLNEIAKPLNKNHCMAIWYLKKHEDLMDVSRQYIRKVKMCEQLKTPNNKELTLENRLMFRNKILSRKVNLLTRENKELYNRSIEYATQIRILQESK